MPQHATAIDSGAAAVRLWQACCQQPATAGVHAVPAALRLLVCMPGLHVEAQDMVIVKNMVALSIPCLRTRLVINSAYVQLALSVQ